MKSLFKKLKQYFFRSIYFIWNKYLRSDKVYTQNGRIYSRKEIQKQMNEYSDYFENNKCFGELSHPSQDEKVFTHIII